MVLSDVYAEVAPLLGLVGAIRALVGWGLAAALYVLVSAQGGLPAVLLAAVATLELSARVVRARAVAASVSAALLLIERVVAIGAGREAAVAIVIRVRLLG